MRIYDLVGLDYELRIANIYDPSESFSINHANTDADNQKYWVAWELHTLYYHYYLNLLKENGIDVHKLDGFKCSIPWSGCEKKIAPDMYNDDNLLLTEEQILHVLEELYPKAYAKVSAPKPIQEFKFEKVVVDSCERPLCKAKLDEGNLLKCRKNGFHLLSIDISPEKFHNPVNEVMEDGRKVYYFEFFMDVGV